MSAVLLLALILPAQDRAETLYARINFPAETETRAWSAKSPQHAKVLRRLLAKKHWIGAFREIETKLGPFPKDIAFDVALQDWAGSTPSMAQRIDNRGRIRFNMLRLARYQKIVDDFEKQRLELAKQGKRMVWKVPPIKTERLIHHELTHVLQGDYSSPGWLHEGLASWIGNDPNYLYAFGYAKKRAYPINQPPDRPDDNYGRGMLFFKWLEEKVKGNGIRALAQGTILSGGDWKAALEKITGMEWAKIVAAEQAWSARLLRRRYTPK